MRGYLGLGSNQGDRLAALRDARGRLEANGVGVVGSSSAYETAPQGEVLDQPDFLNACLAVDTDLEPEPLLDVCKLVERELGRRAGGPRHGPRPIDVDLLLLGDRQVRSERLTLPAPGGHGPALRVGAAAGARPEPDAAGWNRPGSAAGLGARSASPATPPDRGVLSRRV